MSVKVISRVWECSSHGGNELLVLLALADWADDDGRHIYPSVPRIAAKCKLTERGVRYILRKLEASGELITSMQSHRNKNRQMTNEYRIVLNQLRGANCAGGNKLPGANERPKGGQIDAERGATVSDNTSVIHQEPSLGADAPKVSTSTPAIQCSTPTPSVPPDLPPLPTVTSFGKDVERMDAILLAHAGKDPNEKAIVRARCSNGAKGLMQRFYKLSGIPYRPAWMVAANEMDGLGVNCDDVEWAYRKLHHDGMNVTDLFSVNKTAIAHASERKRKPLAMQGDYVDSVDANGNHTYRLVERV